MVVSRARPSHIWLPAGGQTRLAAAVPATDEAKQRAMREVTLQPQNFAEVRIVFSDVALAHSFTTLLHLRAATHEVNSWRLYYQWTRET